MREVIILTTGANHLHLRVIAEKEEKKGKKRKGGGTHLKALRSLYYPRNYSLFSFEWSFLL